MNEHIFLPRVRINELALLPEYREWLLSWLQTVEQDVAQGDIAASMCLQGAMSEIALYGSPQTDWIGNMDAYLLNQEGKPIAYSEKYGQRLYKYDDQWLQSEVHAIHARWWVQQAYISPFPQIEVDYGVLLEQLIQPGGWIYNPSVSETNIKTRMKSEYLMSLSMGVEILGICGLLNNYKILFESAASSVQRTSFLSAEYFRLKILDILGSIELAPVDLMSILVACEAGKGFCDFSVKDKVDDYMGTAKRTARDLAVHSPLSSLHALYIASLVNEEAKEHVLAKLIDFGRYLEKEPFGIPAFKIRDLNTPFGSDVTPLEVLAATAIITLSKQY